MAYEDSCSRCSQNHDCNAVYQKIGNSKGPNVVSNVLVAFMLPIVVFIGALALFDSMLGKVILSDNARIWAAFIPAASVSLVFILIVRMVNMRLAKNQAPEKLEGDRKSQIKQD